MTGNSIIDTFLYVAGSAIAFNVVLPVWSLILSLMGLI